MKASLGWICVVLGTMASGIIIITLMFQVIRVVEAEMARVKKLNQVGEAPDLRHGSRSLDRPKPPTTAPPTVGEREGKLMGR
jgi:hypothetical protein